MHRPAANGAVQPLREAPYHSYVLATLVTCMLPTVGYVSAEVFTAQGIADIVVHLSKQGSGIGSTPSVAWIIEVGLGNANDLQTKMEQAKQYAPAYLLSGEVVVCAIVVDQESKEFQFAWQRKHGSLGNTYWEPLP